MSERECMRLFFALKLPLAVRERLATFQAQHAMLPFRISWTDPFKIHLTLAFLGEQPEGKLGALRKVGVEVAKRHPDIRPCTSTLGGFPHNRAARVLWLGLEDSTALNNLVADLSDALQHQGIAPDKKPFAAHLTLARLRSPADITPLGTAPESVCFKAHELILYRSHLEPKGARYQEVAGFPFSL